MNQFELFSLIVTLICLVSFSLVFTILFRNYNLNALRDIEEGKDDIDLIDDVLIQEKQKKSKKHKIFKVIGRVVYYTLYTVIFIFFSFSLASRIMNNSMLFGNSGVVVIASGSMSTKHVNNKYLVENSLDDQINTYDVIGVSKYNDMNEVELYDVIAFKAKDGRTIVHRIISLEEKDNNLSIITRGDAQVASDNGNLYDGTLRYEDIIGYYNHFNLPLIGSFVIFLQSNNGIITVLAIGYCVVMFDFYRNKLDKAILKRTNLLIELIDYDVDFPDVSNYFKQELIYKGYKYIFNKGEFVEKIEIKDEDIKQQTESKMYSSISIDENNDFADISIKNTKNDIITKVENNENKDKSLVDYVKNINSKNKDVDETNL